MKAKYIVIILCFIFPALGTADTIILKNGKSIAVKKAWEEGGLVKGELLGSVVGYPKDQVLRIEIDKNTQPQILKSGFKFDVWASGISTYECMNIAELKDIPIHRDRLISANKHFNPAISRKYAETSRRFYYKDQILGKWARINLVFTPKSKKLYAMSINWSGAGVSKSSDFFQEIREVMIKKYGKPSSSRKETLFKKIFWEINKDAYAMLQGGSGFIQLHYFDRNYLELAETESVSIKNSERQNYLKKDTEKF